MTRAYNTATTQQNSGGAVAGVTAGKNFVINGGMDIWQRGTSFSFAASTAASSATYTADRWQMSTSGANQAITISRQTTGDTTNLPNIQYCTRFQRNSGQTGTSAVALGTSFENITSFPLGGKTVTLSFYARAGANYSASSNVLTPYITYSAGTDQNVFVFSGGTLSNTNVTLTTTWQRFTATVTVPSTAPQLGIYFLYTPTGTASTNDYYEITGVQLEIGSVATPFSRAGGTIQGELAACQRYYYQTNPIGNAYGRLGLARASSTTNMEFPVPLPVAMRIVPTTVTISNLTTTTANTITAVAFNQATTTCGGVDLTTSSVVSGSVYAVMGNNSTSAYIAFSAEL
jgi:hypothetical protein